MLYLALYVPEGFKPFPREIIENPELSKYIEDWGKESDYGLVAIDKIKNKKIGLIWIRKFTKDNKGYGYVDEETPELPMSVIPEYREVKALGRKC